MKIGHIIYLKDFSTGLCCSGLVNLNYTQGSLLNAVSTGWEILRFSHCMRIRIFYFQGPFTVTFMISSF